MLYLHNVTFFPGKWLTEPERAGFLSTFRIPASPSDGCAPTDFSSFCHLLLTLPNSIGLEFGTCLHSFASSLLTQSENQVTPFHIATNDGEKLFAWLIAPLGVYARHADEFIQEQSGVEDIEEKLAFKLLKNDPEARLLIYFHGNSATIAQQRRTEEYRSYASGASEKIFVLAFDYRGFGASTGNPSEPGLLDDAAAVVDWALNRSRIQSHRIVLLGHSLGTAVAAGIAHHYSKLGVEFAGLILCAAFTNAGSAFSSYSIGGLVPVLAPVKLSATFQTWFNRRMRDTWRTDDRLRYLIRKSDCFGNIS